MATLPTTVPTTVEFPVPLEAVKAGKGAWHAVVGGVDLQLSNLDKPYWKPEGYLKGDLVSYYANIAPLILPALHDRPLTLKRMPDGADGPFFYMKQAPAHVPAWVPRASVHSPDVAKTIDYLLAQDEASLVYLANLGCIEMHPWHSRVDAIGRPDYAFFDLDPFDVPYATTKAVAQVVQTALDALGLRGYPRTSGSTGIHIYVPIDRVHSYDQVREWVGRVCRLVHRADPGRTTMEWEIRKRTGRVFLDHGMNTEGKNIAAVYSLRPEREATVSTPLRWEELATDVEPEDFTIRTIWRRLEEVGDLFPPVFAGGQDLRAAMAAVDMDPDEEPSEARHTVTGRQGSARRRKPAPTTAAEDVEPGDTATYDAMRDFGKTPEPAGGTEAPAADGPRFVIQHHLATRLHHDVRLERGGTLRSWAVPKGLPDVPGVRHMAVPTEDHPMGYLTFEGEIPQGEYGGGPVRIWDTGTYETVEWRPDKVTFTLRGRRHRGTWHLFRFGSDKEWMVTRRDEPVDVPPPPPQLRPMLAGTRDAPFDDPAWLFEVKWDGIRVVATVRRPGGGEDPSTALVTRAGNDVTAAYPELWPLWERVLARNAVLDGEVVALGADGRPSFERLQERMHVRDADHVQRLRRRLPVTLVVFDVLAVDGEALVDQPLEERLARLGDLLVPGTAVIRSEPVREHGCALYAAVEAQGLEGIVAKRAASRYLPGKRSQDWLKIKVRRPGRVVIGGWLEGHGGRSGDLGSLLVGAYDDGGALRYAGRVGTGFDGAERARLLARLGPLEVDRSPFDDDVPKEPGRHWVRPELVCAVQFGEVTSAGRLRAPAYGGLVPDADPRACRCDDLAGPVNRRGPADPDAG